MTRTFATLIIVTAFFGCSDNSNKEATLAGTNPINFLKSLKMTEYQKEYVTQNPVPKNWVKKSDIPFLLTYLDSNSVLAYSVYSTEPSIYSFTLGGHGHSTLAREAYYIIESYRNVKYPPYSTIPTTSGVNKIHNLPDSLKAEILNWWTIEKDK